MPVLPDDQFESYLRQFHPLPPDGMKFERRGLAPQPQMMAVWAAVAAVVIVASLILYPRAQRSNQPDVARWVGVDPTITTAPLTIQSANAMLARAPSFKAAVDAMAASSRTNSIDGKQSALDVLSKDSKL